MYDFQFIISVGASPVEALGNARAFFVKAFPNSPKARLVGSQVIPVMQQGKLVGQIVTIYQAVLTFDSPEVMVVDQKAVDEVSAQSMPLRAIKE
jgi:hypothetical protein